MRLRHFSLLNITLLLAIWAPGFAQSRLIRDIRKNDPNGVPLLLDSIVTITGVVSVGNQFGSYGPAFVFDTTGGVAIYDSMVSKLKIGDSVTITGKVDNFNGLTEIKSISLTKHNNLRSKVVQKRMSLPEVSRIDTSAGYIENEGWLISLNQVKIVTPPADTFAGDMNYTIEDTLGRQAILRIDRDCKDIVGKTIPSGYFNLTGVISQYDNTIPYWSGYQVMPRNGADLGIITPIRDAIVDADSNGIPDQRGTYVTITGVVTVPSGVFSDNNTDIYIQDFSAGVNVFTYDYCPLLLGDSVIVKGRVWFYRGKTEIDQADIMLIDTNHPLPLPLSLTCALINTEPNEGSLVKLGGVFTNSFLLAGNENYRLFDTTGSCIMRIDGDGEIPGLIVVQDTFTIIGIKSQYTTDTLPPVNTGYQLLPRFRTDFSRNLTDILPLRTINEVQTPDPEGFSSRYEGQYVKVRGRITGPNSIFGTSYSTGFYLQDATGGINAYSMVVSDEEVNWLDSIGAEFECIGKVTEYNGLTEIANGVAFLTDSVLIPVQPKPLGFGLPLTETMESDLVSVVGDVNSLPVASGGAHNFVIRNGNPAITIRVLDNTMIPLNWINIGKRIRVIGIVGQYDTDYPFNTNYQLLVRFASDLKDTTQYLPSAEKMRIDTILPNPFAPAEAKIMTIRLNAPANQRLYLEIFDMEGRLVKRLLTNVPGGFYEVYWDGTDEYKEQLPIGIYLLNLKGVTTTGKTEFIRKTVVIATRLR